MIKIKKFADSEFEYAINQMVIGIVIRHTDYVLDQSMFRHFGNEKNPSTIEESAAIAILGNFLNFVVDTDLRMTYEYLKESEDFLTQILDASYFPLGFSKKQCCQLLISIFKKFSSDDMVDITLEEEFFIVSALLCADSDSTFEHNIPQTREQFINRMFDEGMFRVFEEKESSVLERMLGEIKESYDLDSDLFAWRYVMEEMFSPQCIADTYFDRHVFPGLRLATPAAYREFLKIGSFPWEDN